MLPTLARRLGVLLLSLLAASVLVFALCSLLPGDVAHAVLGANASAESVARMRHEWGLDRPAWVRYLDWIGGMLHGDLGRSYLNGRSIAGTIGPRLGVTGWLVGLAMLLASLIALPAGMYAALRRRRIGGFVASLLAQIGLAVPAFLAGVLLIAVFAVRLRWLPSNGYVPLHRDPVQWARHLILPVASLALVQAAVLSRYVRSATIEVLGEDYFRTARAFGWRMLPALARHGVRNISLGVITVLALQLATTLVGAVVVESVFTLPGIGTLLLSSVAQRDLIVVQDLVLILVALVLLLNTLVDVAAVALDPRLRPRGSES